MFILEELTGGEEGFAQFKNEYLFKKPYALPFAGRRFENLIDWSMLDEIFEVRHKNCWLPINGKLPKNPNLNTGLLDKVQARHAFREGRSVVIRQSEKAHPYLGKIALDFQKQFQSEVDIQLYATPKDNEGFDWHYDIEDVFIVQTKGEKEFRIIENTVTLRPLPKMNSKNCAFHLEKKTPELRCWLKPGDFLYIPAGYWHKARALTDSFHMSIGIYPPSGIIA